MVKHSSNKPGSFSTLADKEDNTAKRSMSITSMQSKGASKKKRKEDSSHWTDNHFGCLALLRKLTCSLQCGGTTCSIKETENMSGSSQSPTPSVSSFESVQLEPMAVEAAPVCVPVKQARKRPAKKLSKQEDSAVKKIRRPSKKKQQEQPPEGGEETLAATSV